MLSSILNFLSQVSATGRVMLAVGAVLVVTGVVALARVRRMADEVETGEGAEQAQGSSSGRGADERDGAEARGDEVPPRRGGLYGYPLTQTALGFSLAGLGYHLIVWALPAGLTDLCCPVRLWYVVPVACGIAVGGAYAMERNGL